jgi:hypothetical protein
MQGYNNDPIEIVLDVSDLLIGVIPAKRFFLEIIENSDTTYNGEILEFSIVHQHTPNSIPIETNYTEQDLPVDIASNSTTTLGIDYNYQDVCPPETITLSGYIHLRSPITIPTGVTLNISRNSIVHFEDDGKLIVESGATLNIGNSTKITKLSNNNNPQVEFYNDFFVNSSFSSDVDFIIHDAAKLTIESGNKLTMGEDAGIQVKQGGALAIEECAIYMHSSTGIMEVKSNAILQINPYAILDVPGHNAFDISAGAIIHSQSVHPLDVVPPSYIVTEVGQVWTDANYHMVRDLVIQAESGLTLQNPNMKFFSGRKIEIYPSGILNIDGGLLTHSESACNIRGNWSGIIVKGNPSLPQTYQNQGVLILNSGATVRNAGIAVQAGTKNPFTYPFYHNQGGIIQATNTHFINNRRDIEFLSYQNTDSQGQPVDNVSYFHHCHFTTDDNTLFDTHFENLRLTGVHGIDFNYANFSDNRTNISFNSEVTARKGIRGVSATFGVYNSSFNNLYYGIYATSSNSGRYFKVYYSDFSSYRGIYFNGMDNVVIKNNDFSVFPGYVYDNLSCSDTYGIYIDQSSNFAVENNILISSSDGSTHCGSLGIIARNTGAWHNELYRNWLEGFTIGIEAIGKNNGLQPDEGLALLCNRNIENAFDFFVTSDGLYRPAGIRALQGNPGSTNNSMLAGNMFGNYSSILESNFVNTEAHIFYYHHDTISEPMVAPLFYSDPPKINLIQANFDYSYDVSCPEQLSPLFYFELQEERNAAIALYSETKLLYESYIDDGNTELMTQQVEMTGDGDAYTSYLYLMQTSPYLSEEVLSTLSAKEEGFNKAMIRDVLVENPQSAKSEEVNLALDNRLDPLPAYMRWQINNGLYQFSEMEVMRHFMAYQKTRHDRALNRILGGIIRNEEGFENAPPIEDILADIDDIRYQYMLAEWLFGKGDFAQGMQLLGQIEQDFDLSDEALWYAHEDKLSFYNWLAQWDQEEYPGYFGLPEDALQELEAYLDATPRVAGKALSLLMLNEAIEYEEPILYPIMHLNSEPIHHETMPIISEMDEEFSFSLFPNPSKEYITLDWCFDSPQMTGIIEIRNSKGVLMDVVKTEIHCNQRIYPLTHLKSGSYTATLISGSYIRKTLSFIVIK